MLTLDIFGFQALWSPYFLSRLLMHYIVVIFLLTIKFRSHFQNSEPLTVKQANLIFNIPFFFYMLLRALRLI